MRSVLVTFFIAIAIAATVTAPPIATADDKFDNRCKFNTQTSLLPLPFVAPTPNETAAAPKPRTPSGEVSPKPDDTASKVKAALKRLFAYHSPGVLHPKDNRKGREGDRKVYLPDIIFPIRLGEDLHPHMNSQIYGFGGGGWNGKGAAGGTECAPGNYDHFVQYDNYCEVRGWGMPMCPSGTGHQGVDIRPPSCKDARWEAVAVADGIITRVTRNTTVTLKGTDGTDFYYLHLHPRSIVVKAGQKVKQGDVIGKVSRYMGGKPSTTTHLHFHVRQTVQVNGRTLSTYIPIYTSLINAYRKAKGLGSAVDKNGNLYIDAKYEIGVDPQLDNLPREKTEPEQPKPKDKTGETKEPPKPDEEPEPQDKSKQAKKPDETNTKDQPPKPDTPKPEEKPTQQKPEPSSDPAARLAQAEERIRTLEGKLTQLNVDRKRDVDELKGKIEAANAATADADAKRKTAEQRIVALTTEAEANAKKARESQTELQQKLDDAAVRLAQLEKELAEERKRPKSVWQWLRSLFGGR